MTMTTRNIRQFTSTKRKLKKEPSTKIKAFCQRDMLLSNPRLMTNKTITTYNSCVGV